MSGVKHTFSENVKFLVRSLIIIVVPSKRIKHTQLNPSLAEFVVGFFQKATNISSAEGNSKEIK